MGTIETNIDKTVARMEGQLARWSAHLKDLVAKGEAAGQQAKVDSRKQIDELKAKLEHARAKLAEAKAAGEDKWDAFKHSVESSWKELEGAFRQLAQ